MALRFTLVILLIAFLNACSKDEIIYKPTEIIDPYKLYKEGLEAFEKNDYFFANKKFSEAELNFDNSKFAAKSAIMSIFSLYGINFYSEADENLNRFFKVYPVDENIVYAHYLQALIYFEQMSDEKKDIEPLLKAKKKIDFFLLNYPRTEYAIDLKFKYDLIQNQLAAKELYVAKFYMKTQKWIPAINRLKIIITDFQNTIFIEEALHRLVEIHYHLGLEEEAEKYASILGYNYNSSEWFKQSYKILNKDYDLKKSLAVDKKKSKKNNFVKKIIDLIK
jgi:outer membrane protein assembly factor BamD